MRSAASTSAEIVIIHFSWLPKHERLGRCPSRSFLLLISLLRGEILLIIFKHLIHERCGLAVVVKLGGITVCFTYRIEGSVNVLDIGDPPLIILVINVFLHSMLSTPCRALHMRGWCSCHVSKWSTHIARRINALRAHTQVECLIHLLLLLHWVMISNTCIPFNSFIGCLVVCV